jgi:hypothetical protein
VKDADDLNAAAYPAEVDHVSADVVSKVARPHLVSVPPRFRLLGQLMEGTIELRDIGVRLVLTPSLDRIFGDANQVLLGRAA